MLVLFHIILEIPLLSFRLSTHIFLNRTPSPCPFYRLRETLKLQNNNFSAWHTNLRQRLENPRKKGRRLPAFISNTWKISRLVLHQLYRCITRNQGLYERESILHQRTEVRILSEILQDLLIIEKTNIHILVSLLAAVTKVVFLWLFFICPKTLKSD